MECVSTVAVGPAKAGKTPSVKARAGRGKAAGKKVKTVPEFVAILFNRMRLLGIVPAFYAGAAFSLATGAPTGGYRPEAALKRLEEDLRTDFGMSEDDAVGIIRALSGQLIDVDLLSPEAGVEVSKGISQGTVIARAAIDGLFDSRSE